ncbi:hypothetical protein Hdeb2414_s0007g00242961 [Helianthus debilis subsp. tardiflorus]
MSRLHFQNYGTVGIGEPMGIRVLSGVHFLEVLSYLLPLCNEDTSPVTPALMFSGCDISNNHNVLYVIQLIHRKRNGYEGKSAHVIERD